MDVGEKAGTPECMKVERQAVPSFHLFIFSQAGKLTFVLALHLRQSRRADALTKLSCSDEGVIAVACGG